MKIETNFSLLKYNTFGIKASCLFFLNYSTIEELEAFIADEQWKSLPKLHIGGGSNLLFLSDYKGVVLHSSIKTIEKVQENEECVFLRVGSGVIWDDFVAYCVDHNLCGAENLSYIPGEVGASPVQNVGAYGVEAKDIISEVEVIDANTGEKSIYKGAECGFAYRQSNFKGPWKDRFYVHHVVFRLSKEPHFKLEYGRINEVLRGEKATLKTIREAIISIRKDKLPDPQTIGSAGSFFTNPVVSKAKFNELAKEYDKMPYFELGDDKYKIPAGWLIEQCGWKGKTVKHVGVYEKQSLIIVNHGGAVGSEVAELAEDIKNDVLTRFGIEIKPEVCYIG